MILKKVKIYNTVEHSGNNEPQKITWYLFGIPLFTSIVKVITAWDRKDRKVKNYVD